MLAVEGLSRPELAERYGVSQRVVDHWAQEPDWPEPVGKRGKWKVYDPAATDVAVAARRRRETPAAVVAAGSKMLTLPEIAEMYGLAAGTVRGYASRGVLGEPDEVRDGVPLRRADKVAERMAGRAKWTKRSPE